ncbi:hypothetical protein ACFWGD_06565 [Corynebacterium sp. NPDC060344]|uniref:hypothetical protein n=1 Tax=Corynebacterium sp. NPDC060344 TaxID=3347101 RepID=UPI0036648491
MTRFTRIRAVLAGGSVLGLGAIATLALWSDSEFATASLAASPGDFVVEGRAHGTESWVSHPDATVAAQLNFGPDAGTKLSTGEVISAMYELRLGATSNNDGTAVLNAPAFANLDADVAKRIQLTVRHGDCLNGTTIQQGTLDAVTTNQHAIPLTAGADASTPGAPQTVCFTARLAEGANTEGLTGTASTNGINWHFTVTEEAE